MVLFKADSTANTDEFPSILESTSATSASAKLGRKYVPICPGRLNWRTTSDGAYAAEDHSPERAMIWVISTV